MVLQSPDVPGKLLGSTYAQQKEKGVWVSLMVRGGTWLPCMGKHVWMSAAKEENLWVKWIHSIYLKEQNWWTYSPKVSDNWYWKAICKVKDIMRRHMSEIQLANMPIYSIKLSYQQMAPTTREEYWAKMVWCRLGIPKHRFIMWLVMKGRLNIKDRLMTIGINQDGCCLLCADHMESHMHLFFNCYFSQKCILSILEWLCMECNQLIYNTLIRRLHRKKQSKFRRSVLYAAFMSTIYHIWGEQNNALWNSQVKCIDTVIHSIKYNVYTRIYSIIPKKISHSDHRWFVALNGR